MATFRNNKSYHGRPQSHRPQLRGGGNPVSNVNDVAAKKATHVPRESRRTIPGTEAA